MSKLGSWLVLPLVLLAAPVWAEPPVALRLCIEPSGVEPYIVDAAAAQPGLLLELVERAAKQAGVDLAIHSQPWKRCILEVQNGSSDGLLVALWREERDAWGRFPGRDPARGTPVDPGMRVWRADYRVFVHRQSALQWDGMRFSGVSAGVGAPLGYVISQYLRSLGVLASESMPADKAMNLVAAGRLDGYVLEREVGQALVERLRLHGQLEMLPTPLMEVEWYLPLSHQFYQRYPQLAERFWLAISEQRERAGPQLAQRYLREPTAVSAVLPADAAVGITDPGAPPTPPATPEP